MKTEIPASASEISRATRAVFWWCLWLALLSGPGCATFPRPLAAPGSELRLGPGQECRLPATFDDDAIFVEASVGTLGPLRLIVDTGASCLVLAPDVAARARQAGFLKNGRAGRAGTASGARLPVEFAEALDVRIGPWTVPRTVVAVADFKDFAEAVGGRLDGIAGMALFKSSTLTLDYPGRELRVKPGAQRTPPVPAAVSVPCRFRAHVSLAKLIVGGRDHAAIVDSGFNGSFYFPRHANESEFAAPPVVSAAAASLDGLSEGRHARLATNVDWGGLTFVQPIVQTAAGGQWLIGTRVLREFVTHLDQKSHRLWVSPRTNSPIVFPSWRSLGLALAHHDRALIVKAVIPNTDADRAGIRVGDTVTAINGEPAESWPPGRLSSLRDTGHAYSVELLQDGRTRLVQLRIATLVQ